MNLKVENSCVHIDPEDIERVFEPFYRIDKSNSCSEFIFELIKDGGFELFSKPRLLKIPEIIMPLLSNQSQIGHQACHRNLVLKFLKKGLPLVRFHLDVKKYSSLLLYL